MDTHQAKAIIYHETENPDGFLYRFTVSGKFAPDGWEHLQTAISVFAGSVTDEDETLDRRAAGDLHYLTLVLTIAAEAIQASGEVNVPLEAAASALWDYNHRIFTVPQNRTQREKRR